MSSALATDHTLDAAALRDDFPLLARSTPATQPLVYLDSTATSQKPAAVIAALDHYYRHLNANVHRGVYHLSEAATEEYEAARRRVAAFINAASERECIFVRNTTEAINLVAQTWGRANIGEGDVIVLSTMEHHSNIVPWQRLAAERGAELAYVPLTDDHRLDMAAFTGLLQREPKLVAVTHVSNALGTINDVATVARQARAAGATVLVDAAQSAPHLALDVQALDVDFLAFSGHKMLGPMGIGVLYGKLALLEAMPPFLVGGGMIRKVGLTESTWADVPGKFEGGTPTVGDAIGLAVAIDYLTSLGMDRVLTHEQAVVGYALERLAEIPGITIYGPRDPAYRCGVVSFTVDGIHPHDVASILDGENVAVRAGHHCAQPLMASLGVVATTRASFYLYNTLADVDRLAAALWVVDRTFHGPRFFTSPWSTPAGDDAGRAGSSSAKSGGVYRGMILDHAMRPRNRGVLEPADYSCEDAGSVCGDEIRLDIRVKGNRVSDVAFSGQGCAVSQASASILTELLVDMALADVEALSEDDFLAAIGVPIGPARLECALLALWVLRASLARAGAPARTMLT